MAGDPNSRWNNDDLGALKQLTAAYFEVVQMSTIYTPDNIPTGNIPVIEIIQSKSDFGVGGIECGAELACNRVRVQQLSIPLLVPCVEARRL